jgi:hypothetical protein
VYDIVFLIERKINYFIYFLFYLYTISWDYPFKKQREWIF